MDMHPENQKRRIFAAKFIKHDMNIRKIFTLLLLTISICTTAQEYDIPQESIRIRDPFVTVDKDNGLYYIITAGRSDTTVALRAYESRDLEMWKDMGYVYLGEKGWMKNVKAGKDHWWAPDTYYYRGRYYTIVTMTCQEKGRVNFCTLLQGGRRPTDKYKNVEVNGEPISLTPYGQQALDGSLFADKNGQPWLIYSLEWNGANVQDKVGETWAIRLKKNLKGSIGDPIRLFRANEARWTKSKAGEVCVVDAPFLWRDKFSGKLYCYWSSFIEGVYAVGRAVSQSGSIMGPWNHETEPVYVNGGHEMLFRDLQGNLRMSLHHDNKNWRLKIIRLEE